MLLGRLKQVLVGLVISITLTIQVLGGHIDLTSVKCKNFDTKILNFTKCYSRRLSRSLSENTINVTLYRDITDLTAKFTFWKKSNGKYNPYLLPETTVDCCKFFLKRSKYPIADYLYNQVEAYTNINRTCPFKDYIEVNRMRIDMTKLKWIPLAPGEYTIISRWFTLKKECSEISFSFTYND